MSNGTRTISPRLKKLADWLMERGGATTAEIAKFMGINGSSVDSALKDLTYWGYLWQDGKGGKHYLDYMFDRSVEGGHDLFTAIFGKGPNLVKRDPSIHVLTALEAEHPEDTGVLRDWQIYPTGFGKKWAERGLREVG